MALSRVSVLLAIAAFLSAAPASAADKPNIVVILADDLGYGDVKCLNPAGKIPTPHIDKLAASGMIFTDANSPSSVCTPTRYGIMTGRYAWRSKLKSGVLGGLSPRLIEPGRLTVARLLKDNGYHTACLGKWHLGMDWQLKPGAKVTLHLWRMVAEENECFEQPYPFVNDHAKFLYYRGALSSLHYTPREDHRCTVTLMSGLPGSGKDTWLAGHRPELPVVSLDDIRSDLGVDATDDQGAVIQAAREQCRQNLRDKRDFAFNATNTMHKTRKRWIDLFADYGARIEVVYIEPPLDLIYEQNERRKKGVPRQVLDRLVSKLEPPSRTEGHAVELVG